MTFAPPAILLQSPPSSAGGVGRTQRHTLMHRDGPSTEAEALEKVRVECDEQAVFRLICRAGDRGVTAKEAMRALNKAGLNAISGRFTALQTKHLIHWSGDKREGCRVMVMTPAK